MGNVKETGTVGNIKQGEPHVESRECERTRQEQIKWDFSFGRLMDLAGAGNSSR
jgi:hypothetical protein